MAYAGTTKPIRQIAEELQVRALAMGSVQVVGGRLRVNVQLVDAATDVHLWAERYDRTLDDAFAIQSDIAQQVVAAVGAVLGRREQRALAKPPTANPEAYRLYLQGHEYLRRPGRLRQNQANAQLLFERALALDPEFALAHAGLSEVHGQIHWYRYDRSADRVAAQRTAAERALRLDPDLPQAHVAMGLMHYYAEGDYQRALDEFLVALKGLPNDAEVWFWIGAVHRRLGNWAEVLTAFDRATQLNPRDANLLREGAVNFHSLRRYEDAILWYERALSLAPDLHVAALERAYAYANWHGQLDTLRATLARIPQEAELGWLGTKAAQQAQLFLWARHPDSLLDLVAAQRTQVFEGQLAFLPTSLYVAWAHQLRGRSDAARVAFHSALAVLDSVRAVLPEEWKVHAARGLALAGLGRTGEALAEAEWLQNAATASHDQFWRPLMAEDRARILVAVGETEAAIDEIEQLLARPTYGLSVHTLRLDPRWDPIREHPRFQALLTRHGST